MYQSYMATMSQEIRIDIIPSLKELLEAEYCRDNPVLSCEDIKELLKDDVPETGPRESIVGYPSRPLYRELGHMFNLWTETKSCPLLELPTFDLLDEQSYGEIRSSYIAQITPMLEGLLSLWEHFSTEERYYRLREIIKILGRRGLLDLLGMRKTVGSADLWPPPRHVLETTFESKNHEKSELTVGARALAKHCHRDESSSWWGISTGKEADKNKHATETLRKIMNNAHWINIHHLPHDVKVIEVRQDQGYGARWTVEGDSFRGFLEPQMVDGHEVGWRH